MFLLAMRGAPHVARPARHDETIAIASLGGSILIWPRRLSLARRLTFVGVCCTVASAGLLGHPAGAWAKDRRIAIGGSWGTGYVGLFARYGLPRERLLDPQLADPEVLRRYSLVIVAGTVTNWDAAEKAIAAYVNEGGSALLECTAMPSTDTIPGARLQTQYLEIGVSRRASGSWRSNAAATRNASAVAASLSTARSARTAAIAGWSARMRWNAVRWLVCHMASANAARMVAAEPTMQSRRVC